MPRLQLTALSFATLAVVTLASCEAHAPVPEVCVSMCEVATELYGGCLESWGADWHAAGYDDAAHHQESCETWAWELGLLHSTEEIAEECELREELLSVDECDAYTSMSWTDPL